MRKLLKLTISSVALLTSSLANATLVTDQTNWPEFFPTEFFSTSHEWSHSSVQHAQTFAVGKTGVLRELHVIGRSASRFLVDIRGQVDGHPDNDTVLQTVAINGFAGWASATVIPFDVAVTAGDLLSFVVYLEDGAMRPSYFDSLKGNVNRYSGGDAWTFSAFANNFEGPRSWNANGNFLDLTMDLYFKTVIETPQTTTVPEPNSLYLVLGAAAMFAARRTSANSKSRSK